MSYDLHFWKQSRSSMLPPSEILERLLDDIPVPEVDPLPLAELIRGVQDALPECEPWHDAQGMLQELLWKDNSHTLLITWSQTVLSVEARGGVPGATLNRIIDAAAACACHLYDPQTDTRYDDGVSELPSEQPKHPPAWLQPEQSVSPDSDGWLTCPHCQKRFNPKDPHRWGGGRHTSCGQRIAITAA
jgi:hypothetical protein